MRRTLIPVLVALLVVTASAPAAAFTLNPFADDDTPAVKRFGADGTPSFVVKFDNGSADSLHDWVNATEDARLLAVNNSTGYATLTAPSVAVRGSSISLSDFDWYGGTQLEELSYVEAIWLNYVHSINEPVDLQSESEWDPPKEGTFRFDDPDYPTDGIAFDEDANTTLLSEANTSLGGDGLPADADGDGVTIAVIDTGANTADGAVFGAGIRGSSMRIANASKSFITNESVNVSASNFSAIHDGNGHGTWTLAAAIGNSSGTEHDSLAPNATGLVLRALNDEGEGSTGQIARAIRYAARQNADVISMSLGSPLYDAAIVDAIDYAYDHGVQAVVVAAGNSRALRSPGIASPGDYPPVITVGASNDSQPANAWVAYFSQAGPDSGLTDDSRLATRGAGVDVVAPGMEMRTRVPTAADGDDVSNDTLSGTSMATPQVAAGIAAAMAANATLADAEHETIHDHVTRTAAAVPNASVAEAGHGMFQADRLENGTAPTAEQSEEMTVPARQRQEFYESLAFKPGLFSVDV